MRFCEGCPVHANCCTGKNVDLPVLTPSDVDRIARATGLEPVAFSKETGTALRTMRAHGHGCFFYEDGRCSIYDSRPVDCRMYPFDICLDETGALVWVLHEATCPIPVDARSYLNKVQSLASELGTHLYDFASLECPQIDSREPLVVAPVAAQPGAS